MKITSISTYLEINRTLKKEKGTRAQSGPAWSSGASRLAQRGLPRHGLAFLQRSPCVFQKLIRSLAVLFM
jgi:hypothetical protein